MADEADRADIRIESVIAAGIEDARHHLANRQLNPCGVCHYCNEYVRGAQLFCGPECAEDWEKMKGRNK